MGDAPPVHIDRLAGQEPAILGGQKGGDRRDVGRRYQPSERDADGFAADRLRVLLGVEGPVRPPPQLVEALGIGRPRADGIHGDPRWGHLHRKRLSEPDQTEFRRAVRGQFR